MTETTSSDGDPDPTDLRWVGPATATELDAAGIDATDITAKRVSYRLLVDAGVNPGVAAKIRREHSLSWSFEAGDGLESRSAQVRGLGREEADWIAASAGDWADRSVTGEDENADADGDENRTANEDGSNDPTDDAWSPGDWPDVDGRDAARSDETASPAGRSEAEADGSGDPELAEAAWRKRSRPTPVTDLEAVDRAGADLLSEAGITSVRSLATADPEHVADVLDVDADRVSGWHEAARSASD
ncbi:helix-hairpin-helix domain-containing protein [haloarchaeon 3A1-DGR]|nr:helix-hairpin-helix domain-containing protein [haloarchaeon 3A1-DGR]